MVSQHAEDAEISRITHGDLVKLHASRAAKALNLDTGEFLVKWEAGELDDELERSSHPDVVRWAMLMSFGRGQSS